MLDSLPTKLRDHASWLINAGLEDTKHSLAAMAGTDDEMLMLRAAIAEEKSKAARPSRLKQMEAKLRKFGEAARTALLSPKSAKPESTGPTPAKVVTKAEFAEILDKSVNLPAKPDPAWDKARFYYRAVKTTGRQFIISQICLGWELSNRKKALGFTHGNNQHGKDAQLGHPRRTWQEYLHAEIDPDLTRQTADRFIHVFEGFREKAPKKLISDFSANARQSLITTLSKPPGSLTAKDRKAIELGIAKCSDGETQRSLLEELNLVKCHKPLTGGDTSGSRKPTDTELMGQLAFKFFQPLAEGLHSMRSTPDSEAYLHTIPLTSAEEDDISLASLERDLEAALHDVRAAKKARMKPAAGKVIS